MSLLQKLKKRIIRQQWLFDLVHPIHKAYRVSLMWTAQKLRGIDPKKVVFTCFEGRRYGDNPRYISERLHALCPEARNGPFADTEFVHAVCLEARNEPSGFRKNFTIN